MFSFLSPLQTQALVFCWKKWNSVLSLAAILHSCQGTMSCAFFYGSSGINVVLDCQLTNWSPSVALHYSCQPPLASFIIEPFSIMGCCWMDVLWWWTILDTHGKMLSVKNSAALQFLMHSNRCAWHLLPYPVQRHLNLLSCPFTLCMAHIHNPCLKA